MIQKKTRCVNQIEDVCKEIEKTIKQTIQNTLNSLEKDTDEIIENINQKLKKDSETRSKNFSRQLRSSFLNLTALIVFICCILAHIPTKLLENYLGRDVTNNINSNLVNDSL